MINRALELKSYYHRLCHLDNQLAPFILQKSDWYYLAELKSLLKCFDTLSTKPTKLQAGRP
jgi:hypothetical protein